MHGGAGGAQTDEKVDFNFDIEELPKAPEDGLLFKVLFPLKFFMSFVDSVLYRGFKKPLQIKDVPILPKGKRVDKNLEKFHKWWKIYEKFPMRMPLTLYTIFGLEFFTAGILQTCSTIINIFVPYLMRQFLLKLMPMLTDETKEYLDLAENILPPELVPDVSSITSNFRENNWEAWIFLLAFAAAYFAAAFLQINAMQMSVVVGMRQRSVLTSAMYQKSLRLSNKARAEYQTGQIINFISTDTLKVERINMMFHFGWTSIFTLGGSIYFLIDLIDWGTLSAGVTPLLTVPFLVICMVTMLALRAKSMKVTDTRVKRINEFLQGIKIIKFFSWENTYLKNIGKIRAKEVNLVILLSFFLSFMITVFLSTPQIMSVAAFVTYYFVHGYLDPITIFTSLTYINMLQAPVAILPMMMIGIMECFLSYNRITKLLEADELQPRQPGNNKEHPVFVEDGNFKWEAVKKPEEAMTSNKEKKEKPSFKKMMQKIKESKGEKKKEIELKEHPFELKDINIKIKKGELVCVIGKVGSGKSSLLQALLGEMKKTNGKVEVTGEISYCSQTPWIQNATLLDNVLFGKELDETKFERVVHVSCLTKDLQILKGGRMIEIGEKGINLSGGQKYRVSLARSAYSDADVYFLDDPLAAVDAHVGKKIFENCICGYLKNKTRVLVTHQIQVCEKADRIIMLEKGNIIESGTYKELMEKEGAFYTLISENLSSEKAIEEEEEEEEEEEVKRETKKQELISKEEKAKGMVGFKTFHAYVTAGGGWVIMGAIGILFLLMQAVQSGNSWFLSEWSAGTFLEGYGNEFTTHVYENFTLNETWFDPVLNNYISYVGIVPNFTYEDAYAAANAQCFLNFTDCYFFGYYNETGDYVDAELKYYNGSSMDCPVMLDLTILNITDIESLTNLDIDISDPSLMAEIYDPSKPTGMCISFAIEVSWDSTYSNGTKLHDGLTHTQSVFIYGGVGLGGVILSFLRDMIFTFFCLAASRKMHKLALKRVGFSPMKFFDTTPIGRIINRFSTDFEMLDFRIIRVLSSFIGLLLGCIGTFAIMGYSTNGLFLPLLIPIGILYFVIYVFYRRGVIELKRMYSVSRSPLFAHVTETLNGMPTIRAYSKSNSFIKENMKRIDVNNCSYYYMMSSQRWLALRLQMVGFLIIAAVCAISIVLSHYGGSWATSNLSYIAMGVSYSMSISMLLNMLFTQFTEAEVLMNSVERVDYYSKELEQEKPHELPYDETLDPKKWPSKGMVEFKNFYLRYRDNLPFVLQDINLKLRPHEKLGVVGRTGSGKSTLMVALFRLVEPLNGTIYIDGVDIQNLGLRKLRRSISIIPQDPVLFTGTVRSNLDPFNEHTDEEILEVLKGASLEGIIEEGGVGIDGTVTENGENFSAGERQLLCLARALLRGSKVLILDECTASVDVQSDKIIQETIRKNKERTVLTIAHRINTIIDYDRVLVMEKGRIAELDTPKNLLSKKKYHIFKELVDETGPSNSVHLKKIVFGDEYEEFAKREEIWKEEKKKKDKEEIENRIKSGIFSGFFNGEKCDYALNEKSLDINDGDELVEYSAVESFTKNEFKDRIMFEIGLNGKVVKCIIKKEESELFQNAILKKMQEADETSEGSSEEIEIKEE